MLQKVSVSSARSTTSPVESLAVMRRLAVDRQVLLRLARLDQQQAHVARRRAAASFACSTTQQNTRWSKSSPPSAESPLVATHLEHAARQLEDRDVEGAAAEVVDRVGALGGVLEAVGDRRRGRLVQQPQHVQAGELRRVLGRLALRVVEVRGHGDHGARRDRLAGTAPRARAAPSGSPRRPRPGSSRRRRCGSAPCRARRRSRRARSRRAPRPSRRGP